jgi:hypothetical protein
MKTAALSKVAARASTVRELIQFLWKRKLWWLIPVVVLLLVTTLLIAVAQTAGVGRFIYPGF